MNDTILHVLAVTGDVLFVLLCGSVLLLHWVSLPANWVLLGLALVYALATRFDGLGWGSLAVLAGLAVLAEILEFVVGLGYTAKLGATRWGVAGAFFGGILGAVLGTSIVPPLGSLIGAFAGSFGGAVGLEYVAQKRVDVAIRSGRAAFIAKVLAALIKTTCGFWMWCVLVYQLFVKR